MNTGHVYIIDAEPYSNHYYIGITVKTLSQRLYYHMAERNKKRNHKNYWLNFYKEYINITTLEAFQNDDIKLLITELQYWEEFYISLFKSWGVPLLNYTNGGNGYKGNHSKATKELLSKIATGKKRGKYKWTKEGKKGILNGRKKLIGRTHSESTKEKIGSAQVGKKNHRYGKTPIESILTCAMPVKCLDNNQLFRSIKQTAKYFSINESAVKRSCLTNKPTVINSLTFQHISKEEYYESNTL